MKLENKCVVPADKDTTWSMMMDIPKAAACVPGMQDVIPEGKNRYEASLRVKVGPMTINLAGTVEVLEQDQEKGEARYLVEASDRRIGGSVKTDLSIRMVPLPDGKTEVNIISDTTFMGRLGELGQPLIRRKVRTTVEDFASNLAKQLGSP